MVRYFCNRCKDEVPKGQVYQFTIVTGDSKKIIHLCPNCYNRFTAFLKQGVELQDDESDEREDSGTVKVVQVTEERPNVQLEETTPVNQFVVAPIKSPDVDKATTPDGWGLSFANVETIGAGATLDDIHNFLDGVNYGQALMDVTPIPANVLEKYFVEPMISFGPRSDVVVNIRLLLSFYRGRTMTQLRSRYSLSTMQQVHLKLMNHVSLAVYKRWFDLVPNFGLSKEKICELLTYIESSMQIRDSMADVGLDYDSEKDRSTLFTIIEYYIGVSLSDIQKNKLLGIRG